MKKLLVGLLMLGCFSVFSQDSEFERGYEAGVKTCKNAEEAWLCSIKYRNHMESSSAATRADAIIRLGTYHLEAGIREGNKPKCEKL